MGFAYSDGKLVLHIDRLDLYECSIFRYKIKERDHGIQIF